MDSAPSTASLSQPLETEPPHAPSQAAVTHPQVVPALAALYVLAEAHDVGLHEHEFAHILLAVGECHNYNQPSTVFPGAAQQESFFRSLHLADLALAYACVLGRDSAWQIFLTRFRAPLLAAATAITRSATAGKDLAESLPAELFGLSTRSAADGAGPARRSPLASYSGRGSLLGWLRSTLAQRHIDHHRRTFRESPVESDDVAAVEREPTPPLAVVARLQAALASVLHSLDPEDAFVLTSWFLDGRTLLQIARLLHVSEATVSRKVKRLTGSLRGQLIKRLQAGGLSRRAAEEALGTDPRDLTLNMRALLQKRAAPAFSEQTNSPAANAKE